MITLSLQHSSRSIPKKISNMAGILTSSYKLNGSGSKNIEIGISPENFEPCIWISKEGFPKVQLSYREYYDVMSYNVKANSFFKSSDTSLYTADIPISSELKIRYVSGGHTKCIVLDREAATAPAGSRLSGTQSVWLAEQTWQNLIAMRKLVEHILLQRVRCQRHVESTLEKIVLELKEQYSPQALSVKNSSEFIALLLSMEDTLYAMRQQADAKNNEGLDHVQYYFEIITLCSAVIMNKFQLLVEADAAKKASSTPATNFDDISIAINN